MSNKINIEYPALIYKKNAFFVANCVMFNLSAIGRTEVQAIENLQKSMNQALSEYNISIIPIYESQYMKLI
ncbi:MAG: hypothetical protein A2287_02660 [Candidatus Melainabacteria bacterium RIFOXYA12_FULL_32_12]|nr:MAG: hypothetical protein A2255_02435 [Candidatus Melainabacteria bacterium RIFOXYA2_FULL_32_9]OGI30832.1 MAG: hypothetical protein A2287_02660 [Candidatus Melainabacteria bacterium RIFOXYA12_FULL_32_12]